MQVVISFALALFIVLFFASYWERTNSRRHEGKHKILISLGSGGHTTEMLLILRTIDMTDFDRLYYVTSGDSLSIQHARGFEDRIAKQNCLNKLKTRVLPRARKVGQSWFTTVFTTLRSLSGAIYWVYKDEPDLLVCNGPGTCVMLVFAALFFRILHIKHCRIIFIESFARVKRLSLSGKILIHLVDRFLVMWPELADQYKRAEYAGMLI